MRKYVENLRDKPKEVRSQVALVGAGVVTSVFALIWAVTLPGKLTVDVHDSFVDQVDSQRQNQEETRGMFSGFFDSLGDANLANPFAAGDDAGEVAEQPKKIDIDQAMRDGAASVGAKPKPGDVVTREDNVILIATSTAEGTQ